MRLQLNDCEVCKMDIMITKPIPRKAIWGYTKLKDYFHYDTFPNGIGQSWSFSGQNENANLIVDGMHVGKTIAEIWKEYPHYFNSKSKHFPFIIGLVGAEDHLSIQVHPDAVYARKHGLLSGKNEAWYFIDVDTNADLVLGTTAKNKKELVSLMERGKWEQLLNRIPVYKDDFVYVPAGMLHAMQKGVIAYEVQEATDITYRFYDYHRQDAYGNKRELHLKEAIESIHFFDTHPKPLLNQIKHNGYKTTYINNESFKIQKYQITKNCTIDVEAYMLVTIISGSGKVNEHSLTFGDSFLVPSTLFKLEVQGKMEWMVTMEGKKSSK